MFNLFNMFKNANSSQEYLAKNCSQEQLLTRHDFNFDKFENQFNDISLEYNGKTFNFSQFSPLLTIGRSDQNDLILNDKKSSRNHAIIRYQHGKFILSDKSTNGTTIIANNGRKIYLLKEDLELYGKGLILIGKSYDKNSTKIYFNFPSKIMNATPNMKQNNRSFGISQINFDDTYRPQNSDFLSKNNDNDDLDLSCEKCYVVSSLNDFDKILSTEKKPKIILELKYGEKKFMINANNTGILKIGRSTDSDLIIENSLISRHHATIRYENGHFFLADKSTNGTILMKDECKSIRILKEEIKLSGNGQIVLGKNEENEFSTIIFRIYEQ